LVDHSFLEKKKKVKYFNPSKTNINLLMPLSNKKNEKKKKKKEKPKHQKKKNKKKQKPP